jgi:formylglycine-generating enzyme required for sulfatase activity
MRESTLSRTGACVFTLFAWACTSGASGKDVSADGGRGSGGTPTAGGEGGLGGTPTGGRAQQGPGGASSRGAGGASGAGGSGGAVLDASTGSNLVCTLASWSIAYDSSCPAVDFTVPDLNSCRLMGCARAPVSAPGCCLPSGRCGGAAAGASQLLAYGCHAYADFESIWMASGVPSDPNISCSYPSSDAGSDASTGSGGSDAGTSPEPTPPSCDGLPADCGPSSDEGCCVSPLVYGGPFGAIRAGSISTFRLDKYEITVGRFRKFVNAVKAGWSPAPGSGKHVHLNGGRGLAASAGGGVYEAGWTFTAIPANDWFTGLRGYGFRTDRPTWTEGPGSNENKPINFVRWWEAYAFCIWDGGFLPTQAEWTYAAAGGSEHRAYPWSIPSDSLIIDCTYANYANVVRDNVAYGSCTTPGGVRDVGLTPKGNGRYRQTDLVGNAGEFSLDAESTPGGAYAFPQCSDCVCVSECNGWFRPVLGGGPFSSACGVLVHPAGTPAENPTIGSDTIGARCARPP